MSILRGAGEVYETLTPLFEDPRPFCLPAITIQHKTKIFNLIFANEIISHCQQDVVHGLKNAKYLLGKSELESKFQLQIIKNSSLEHNSDTNITLLLFFV